MAKLTAALYKMVSRESADDLLIIPQEDGSLMGVLDDSYNEVAMATRDAKGNLRLHCIDTPAQAQRVLEGKANVHRIWENGGPTSNGLAKIDAWLAPGEGGVIHFNWGLHDLKQVNGKYQVPLEDYEKNLTELVKKLKATGAKLVWASTTPVPEGDQKPPRKAEDPPRYNAAAKKIMDENGVAIDDLYAFALPKLKEIQLISNVHYTPKGYQALGEEVAKSIQGALEKK